jgi:hypothetical protein
VNDEERDKIKREQGEAMLEQIRAGSGQRERVAQQFAAGMAAKVAGDFSDAEERFFAELDDLRRSDPDEFQRLSPATKASYGTWRYARDNA